MKFKIIVSLLVFFLIANLVFTPTISGLKEDSSSYGNLMIDNDILSTINQPLLLKIFGEVFNPVSDNKVTLVISKPDSFSVVIILSLDDSGTFYTNHGINTNWTLGDYSIKAIYQDYEIGIVSFELTDEAITVTSDPQQEPTDTTTEPTDTTTEPTDTITEPTDTTTEPTDTITTPKKTYKDTDRSIQTISESVLVPDWIKNNAKWWASGALDDGDFSRGIEYMIKEKIIHIPQVQTEKEMGTFTVGEIPDWIKNNAKWWSDDQIDEETFLSGIEYLVKEGIIKI